MPSAFASGGLMTNSIHQVQKQSQGFTLIEVLVVIAVIALLAALIMPTLRTARLKAYEAGCANNIRQLGMGMKLYSSDWGCWPSRGEVNDDFGASIWVGLPPCGQPRVTTNTPAMPESGALATYLGYPSPINNIFLCPQINKMPRTEEDLYIKAIKISYVMNGVLGNWRVPTSVVFPTGTYLFIEPRGFFNGSLWTPNDSSHVISGADKAASRHHGGAYAAMCDGHVMWRRYEQMDADMNLAPNAGLRPEGPPIVED